MIAATLAAEAFAFGVPPFGGRIFCAPFSGPGNSRVAQRIGALPLNEEGVDRRPSTERRRHSTASANDSVSLGLLRPLLVGLGGAAKVTAIGQASTVGVAVVDADESTATAW